MGGMMMMMPGAAAGIIQALEVGREKGPIETEGTKDILAPDGEVFIKHSSPPRCHCHAGGARPTFTEGNPLRLDLLSQGRGLFLKQTLPEKTPGGPRPPTDV